MSPYEMKDPTDGLSRSCYEDDHFPEALEEAMQKGLEPGTDAFRSFVLRYCLQFPYRSPVEYQPSPELLAPRNFKGYRPC